MQRDLRVGVGLLVGFFGACSDDAGSAGTGGQTASGATTASGAVTATSTTSGMGGAGGTGGAPPACGLPATGCGAGDKCSVVDLTLGIPAGLGCVPAGDGVEFSYCDSDSACGEGLFCDYSTAVCKSFCGLEGFACSDDSLCVVGRNSAGMPVDGLYLCVADCSPLSMFMQPCADDPLATCYFRDDVGLFDCGGSENGGWISPCQSGRDCRSGLGCFGGYCLDWCTPVGGVNACYGTKSDGEWFCDQFEPCGPCVATPYDQGGTPLGSCDWGS